MNHFGTMSADERSRGILNNRQREYLRGESNIVPKTDSERSIRQSIRENLRNAMLDFRILLQHMEARDREQVFDPKDSHREGLNTLPAAIGFLYLANQDVSTKYSVSFDNPLERFEYYMNKGITQAEVRNGWNAIVDVQIDVEHEFMIKELANQLDKEEIDSDLTFRELNVLLKSGNIDPEVYGEIMQKRLSEGTVSEELIRSDLVSSQDSGK